MPLIGRTKRQILTILVRRPLHGYALSRQLRLPLSTVYEHLYDLEREGMVAAQWSGRRRVWALTPKGKSLAKLLELDE